MSSQVVQVRLKKNDIKPNFQSEEIRGLVLLGIEGYDEIHFFGDKTYEGGNDYEIFEDSKTIGHTVKSWQETKDICNKLFF